MADREKTIAALEYCRTHGDLGGRDCYVHCNDAGYVTPDNARDRCPMKECKTGCIKTMILDAIGLLKAQEPRVMTLEEAQGADYCWYESRTWKCCILVSAYMVNNLREEMFGKPMTGFEQMGAEDRSYMYDDEYGKDWRCWDKEPSYEQMEATPWKS